MNAPHPLMQCTSMRNAFNSYQQDRSHTAVANPKCGHNSELEPDEQDRRDCDLDRQGSKGRQGGRCAEVFSGSDECGERNVRRENRSEDVKGESGGHTLLVTLPTALHGIAA